jgi:RNA polymerase sigma-70 factor (ECF subfamily)
MTDEEWLAEAFEGERPHLRAVAYRMLGSLAEADDAVQEAWLRLSRSDTAAIENLRGWLTTVVGRVALDQLRRRRRRAEQPWESLPDPVVSLADEESPEHEALLADSVGLALMVVLETLSPAERLAFVLHDLFGVPFAEVAPMIDRSPDAAKMLASRARHRVRTAAPPPPDAARQRAVVDAFLAASRSGDLEALVAVLHPDVLVRGDVGGAHPARLTRGAHAAARQALGFAHLAAHARPVLVNGLPGLLAAPGGRPFSVLSFTIVDDLVTELDILADPVRLAALDLRLDDGPEGAPPGGG